MSAENSTMTSQLQLTLWGLVPSTNYVVNVVALNGAGEGNRSNNATATTLISRETRTLALALC